MTTRRLVSNGSRFSVVAAAGRAALRAANAPVATARGSAADPLAAMLPAGGERYLRKPWSMHDLTEIGTDDRVLVMGTGSTAVQTVAALQRQWHRGLIRLVSRETLLPQRLLDLRAAGRVEVWVGRIKDAAGYGDTFVVDVLPHGRRLHSSERYDWIIDCT
jgi:uncharacterized NAD(P)/FAD-binding protein YdhS